MNRLLAEKTAEMDELFRADRVVIHGVPRIGYEYTAIFKDASHQYLEYVGVCIKHTPEFSAAAFVVAAEFALPSALAAERLTQPVWLDKKQVSIMIPHYEYAQTPDGKPLRYLGLQRGTHHVFLKSAETRHILLHNHTIDVLGFICNGPNFDSEYYK